MPHIKSLRSPIPAGPAINYYDFLFRRPELRSWPDYTLFVDATTGRRRRFRETLANIEDCATALTLAADEGGLDMEPGSNEVVGILSENCLEYPVLVLALLKITVPVALIPAHLSASETTALLKRERVRTIFVSPKRYASTSEAIMASGISEDHVFILRGHVKGKTSLSDMIDYAKVHGLPQVPTRPVLGDTLACVVFSNGTSGFSKDAFILRLFITPTTLVVLPQWNVDLVIKALLRHTINHIVTVPPLMHQLLNHPEFSKVDLNDLESVSIGANRLRGDLSQKFDHRAGDVPFATEADDLLEDMLDRPREHSMSERVVQTLIAMAEPFPGMFKDLTERQRGSAGILLPGTNARVAHEDGSEADFGETSELFPLDSGVALGNPDDAITSHLESFTPDARPGTGETPFADEERRIFSADRLKDTIKIHGVHICPLEIEKIIREHPEVVDCVVAGVRGACQSDGIVPRAWLVLSESAKAKGVDCILGAIEEFLRGRLSDQHWLHGGFEVIDEIPKLPCGKVLRRQLQHAHESREGKRAREQAKL
ncbi:acetyl-CoA synthetase-like protein [Lactarius hatsudake]|nr:acetyl-CoA synthetase-like protein [Lactarius hatsudake]